MSLDRLSLSTVPITPFFNDLALPQATAFIWKRRERFYLITNWHVVSALNFFTKVHLAKGGSRPNKLRCDFLVRVGQYDVNGSSFQSETRTMPLCGSFILFRRGSP